MRAYDLALRVGSFIAQQQPSTAATATVVYLFDHLDLQTPKNTVAVSPGCIIIFVDLGLLSPYHRSEAQKLVMSGIRRRCRGSRRPDTYYTAEYTVVLTVSLPFTPVSAKYGRPTQPSSKTPEA